MGHHASCEEEVELEKVVAPRLGDGAQAIAHIGTYLGVSCIEDKRARPVEGRAGGLTHNPFGVLGGQLALLLADEGGKPDAGEIALLVGRAGDGRHAPREAFGVIAQPVTNLGVAVIDLEEQVGALVLKLSQRGTEPLEVAEQALLADVSIVSVPARIADELVGGQRVCAGAFEPGVERLSELALADEEPHELALLACG